MRDERSFGPVFLSDVRPPIPPRQVEVAEPICSTQGFQNIVYPQKGLSILYINCDKTPVIYL